MSNTLKNRMEATFFVQADHCNPNGDPDAGNLPRVDAGTGIGYMTDVCIKRRIRDCVMDMYPGVPGMNIIMQKSTNINRFIAEAFEATGAPPFTKPVKKGKDAGEEGENTGRTRTQTDAAREWLCKNFFDVRTFGAVLSTGQNAGQVQGAVQIDFSKSIDPIIPDNIGITRACVAKDAKDALTTAEYAAWEEKNPHLRTMGRKCFVPFALYRVNLHVSANLAARTGFTEADFNALVEVISRMFDDNLSSSKSGLSLVGPVIIFKHVGDPDKPVDVQERQARLGRAPAQNLFELVTVERKNGAEREPTSRNDYDARIDLQSVPRGIEVGFFSYGDDEITWGEIPTSARWLKALSADD